MAEGSDKPQFTLTSPFGPDVLHVDRWQARERLSAPFEVTLFLTSEADNLSFDKIVGQSVTLKMERPGGDSPRYLSGVVGRFIYAGSDARLSHYVAEVHPWLWMLKHSFGSQIFQDKSVPDIVEALFQELGFNDFRKNLKKTYAKREYCVQYQETAFDFASRLLEEEGIFYFFEHESGKHTLVLADDRDAHKDCPGRASVDYRAFDGGHVSDDMVISCQLEESVRPTYFKHDDFNFETPKTNLLANDGSRRTRTVYEYPGGFGKKNDGTSLARVRLEELQNPGRMITGESAVYAFTAGGKFALKSHPRSDVNTNYVLLSVTHEADQNGYRNRYEAFPLTVPFRPPRLTSRPTIPGTQTAIVAGKSGEEIWTDKFGRVMVKFHWDQSAEQNEKASCWIRVAQGWAGKSWGALFLPRVGQEVVVSFLNGDPDQPLVTGSVYNGEQLVPYKLPTDRTKSTVKSNSSKGGGGFNEIRFEDKKGSEEIYVHAQKDAKIEVLNDRTESVGNDETITITNKRTTTIEKSDETLTVSKGNRTIRVSKGNETHQVKGTRALTITGNETHTNKGDFTQKVQGNYTLKVTGNVTIKATGSMTLQGQSITSKASTSLTNKAGTSLTNQSGTSLTNKAGTSMTNKASMSITNKASMSYKAEGSMSMAGKGGMSNKQEAGLSMQVKGLTVKLN